MTKVEDRIRILFAIAGRDQGEVARAAGLSPAMLSRALRGQRRMSIDARRRVVEQLVDACLAS